MIGLEFWALTLDTLGKLMLGIMAILVHQRVKREHKIDKIVLKEMRVEKVVGITALLLIILGYSLHLTILYN